MTFASVGSGFNSGSSSFSLTTSGVGNFVLLEVVSRTTAEYATALSSSNVTWSVLVAATAIPSQATYATVFIGKVTTAGTATVTVSFNSGTPAIRIAGNEFSTTAGYAAVTLDSAAVTPGSFTDDFPTITPAFGAGELYFGFAYNAGAAVAGSTPGYTYYIDSNSNGACWNPACANAAQTPVWGDTDGIGGMAAMVYEAGGPPPASPGMLLAEII